MECTHDRRLLDSSWLFSLDSFGMWYTSVDFLKCIHSLIKYSVPFVLRCGMSTLVATAVELFIELSK